MTPVSTPCTKCSQLRMLVFLVFSLHVLCFLASTSHHFGVPKLLATREQMTIWFRTIEGLDDRLTRASSPRQVTHTVSTLSHTILDAYPFNLFEYHQGDISRFLVRAISKIGFKTGQNILVDVLKVVKKQSWLLNINTSLPVRNLLFSFYYGFPNPFEGNESHLSALVAAFEDNSPSLASYEVICHAIAEQHGHGCAPFSRHRNLDANNLQMNTNTTAGTRDITDCWLHFPERLLPFVTDQTLQDVLQNLNTHKSRDVFARASFPAKLLFLVNVVLPAYKLQPSIKTYQIIRSHCVRCSWLYTRGVFRGRLSQEHPLTMQVLHRLNDVANVQCGWQFISFPQRFPGSPMPYDPTREILSTTGNEFKRLEIEWRKALWNNRCNEFGPNCSTRTELYALVQSIVQQNINADADRLVQAQSHLRRTFWTKFFERFYSLSSEYEVEFILQILAMMEGNGSRFEPDVNFFGGVCTVINNNLNMDAASRDHFTLWIYDYVIERFRAELGVAELTSLEEVRDSDESP